MFLLKQLFIWLKTGKVHVMASYRLKEKQILNDNKFMKTNIFIRFLCKIVGGGAKFELEHNFSTVNLEYIYF